MDSIKVKKILLVTLLLNWLVALAKILIGLWSGSISIMADGFHSLFDGISNVLGLIGVKISEKPTDDDHPYGHRKFEAVASLGIAFLVAITSYEFLKSAIGRFRNPVIPEINSLVFVVMILALLVDIFVYFYESHYGKKLKSTILIVDSLHTKAHLLTTPTVVLGVTAIKLGFPIFDPLITFFLVIMLVKLIWEIVEHTTLVLCDSAFVDEEKIKKIVQTVGGISSSHQIRTRGDDHYVFLDMHIELNSDLTLEEAHGISHELKDKIMKEIPQIKDVVIHMEPADKK